MKPSSLKKVFGIISYFPDNDSAYHIETRRERSRRFKELLARLEELWPDVDIMVIAQNWQDFAMPNLKNKTIIYRYEQKLGILGARRELRKQFLASEYDYLIMPKLSPIGIKWTKMKMKVKKIGRKIRRGLRRIGKVFS